VTGVTSCVLDIVRGGIDSALLGLGHASVRDLSPGDLVPPGFIRDLGAAAGHGEAGRSARLAPDKRTSARPRLLAAVRATQAA
jgi:hypothetical protein